MKKSLSILTVLGKDRAGIIAGVTEILFRRGCNLEDISMTVLEGEFAMMMVVCLKAGDKKKVEADLAKLQRNKGLDFFWKDLKGKRFRGEIRPKGVKTYFVSAIGADRTGIVFKVSRFLADRGVNITDLNSKILGSGGKTLYAMILEADIPAKLNIFKIEAALKRLAQSLKIEISLRPLERIDL